MEEPRHRHGGVEFGRNGPPCRGCGIGRSTARGSELGIEHGPRLGELLAAIAEGQYCGSVTDEQSAVELARTLLASGD